ncbi:ABC transporter ATP-binding protein [Halomicroarcula sp. GCM10025709]|uniref:ABC transporter ATP-binding protein n=1 Tax=Haloarcula TaxID=2237 RepID=UPI0024C28483|nr:sn-glycerol-3-phosphate ABC transporter ATP-binding protein UgpC [Halomicroarcula sp. YJ-61-S]
MSQVTFQNVEKRYDDVVAVQNIDLEIRDGEFLSVLGPSGSGKSTVLRMVAGLEDITGGTIKIGDRVINDVHPRDRGIAMVFQNYALYPHMTVRENMSYGLQLTTDLSKDEISQRVESAAEMMGISEHLEKRPAGLSGGQQQRVATGRAIVREPEVFLMDEPLSNLDAKLKMHMRTELQRIHDELDTTTMYVTHDQEEAMTMSDRIVIIADGTIQQVGSPDEIYNQPANLFVADFIGSPAMNLFDIRLDGDTLVHDEFEYELSAELAERVRHNATSDELIMGIRPEDISVADAGATNVIETAIDVVEPIGSDNFLYVQLSDEECTVRASADFKPAHGDPVSLTFDETSLHLFDTQTDQNILAGEERQLGQTA